MTQETSALSNAFVIVEMLILGDNEKIDEKVVLRPFLLAWPPALLSSTHRSLYGQRAQPTHSMDSVVL